MDRLIELVGDELSEAQLAAPLDALEKLSCIKLTMGEIVLYETIVVRHEN